MRLRDVALAAGRLRLHQTLFWAIAYLALVAGVTFFFPWHEVREGGISALGCAFLPDCRPPPPSDAVIGRHTGLAEHGALPVVLLAVIAAVAAWTTTRRRLGPGRAGC